MSRCLLPALLALATTLPAQGASFAYTDDDGKQLCTVRTFSPGGTLGGVGLGFTLVDVQNLDDKPHGVSVRVAGFRRSGGDVDASRKLVVEGGERARFWLPTCVPPQHARVQFEIEGSRDAATVTAARTAGPVGLFVSDRTDASSVGTDVMDMLPFAGSKDQAVCLSEYLPSDWRLFTTFPVVIVDGRANVNGEVQEALRRYVFAGGVVIALAPERLPAGSLREQLTRLPLLDGMLGHHGRGALLATPDLDARRPTFRALLRDLSSHATSSFPVADDYFVEQDIEGLGRAPVGVFVLVITLFAVLVGPVNFFVLRRRKRPMLALLTVPVAGFGTTAAILLYGVFHDGFGVRGTVTTWTVLDQVRHEGATVAARTLFAGLAPSELTMAPDVVLLSQRAGADHGQHVDRWHWDVDRQRLDGGVLPSRTVTPLVSVQQGTVRERLTVRRVDADTLEVLPGGGVAPVGEVLLRDLDGDCWRGEAGRLRRVDTEQWQAAFFAAITDNAEVRTAGTASLSGRLGLRLPEPMSGARPVPGSYLVRVARAPWIDEHDLAVAYDAARHVVFGRMDAGDFVR